MKADGSLPGALGFRSQRIACALAMSFCRAAVPLEVLLRKRTKALNLQRHLCKRGEKKMIRWQRWVSVVCVELLVSASAVATAETPSPEAFPSPSSHSTPTPSSDSVTQAFGEIPERLEGLWLMVTHAKVGPDKIRNNFQLYRIRHAGDRWSFQRLEKPKHLNSFAPFIAAQDMSSAFLPSRQQIDKVKADRELLAALPAYPESATFQVVHLRTAAEIPSHPPPPPAAAGAKLVIEFLERTGSSSTLSAVSFYVKKIAPDRMEGDIHALTLLAGLGVVPVVTPGKFVMYRIE